MLSEPLFTAKVEKHRKGDGDRQDPECGVAVTPLQLRHVVRTAVEVHPIDSYEEGKWHEKCRKKRQDAHDFVRAVAQAGMIDIHKPRSKIPVIFDNIDDLRDVLIAVPQINSGVWSDEPLVLMH